MMSQLIAQDEVKIFVFDETSMYYVESVETVYLFIEELIFLYY